MLDIKYTEKKIRTIFNWNSNCVLVKKVTTRQCFNILSGYCHPCILSMVKVHSIHLNTIFKTAYLPHRGLHGQDEHLQ